MKNLVFVLALVFITAFASAQTAPSAIFYSDLTSGPNTGGQNNAGAFVTIHGKGFGTSQGSSYVTVGGGAVACYPAWSDSAITFQLGAAAKTGNIVVNIAGVTSNSVPFTVRAGNIYFVSTGGSDSNTGSYSAPWRSVVHAASAMQAGDIAYLENGYSRPRSSGGTALTLSTSGTVSAPIAIVAYPNASASIGSTNKSTTGIGMTGSYWVIAGLTLAGSETAISTSGTGARIAANNISCPNGYGNGACLSTTNGSSIALLGNQVHDSGSTSSTDLENYQSVRLLGTNTAEVGWNQVLNTRGCNAISVQPNGSAQYGLTVHDNFVQNTRCEAISLSNVNPALGAVNVYNNIIAASGTGPVPGGTAAGFGYAAIRVGGSSSTPAQIFNNTVYNAGSAGGASAGAIRVETAASFSNNIFYVVGSEQYVSSDSNVSLITGTNNLFYGAGNPLGVFANSTVADPLFVNATGGNFHVQATSPAIDKGTTVSLASDFDGVLRPQGAAYDIGAYESVSINSTSTITTGTMSASPSTLSFGTVTVGQSTSSTTVLTNTGTGSVTLSGANSTNSAFQASGITFPLTLAAGQSASLTVSFAPTTSGTQTGTIALASNASNSPLNISVSGTAAAAIGTLAANASSLSFGSVNVGSTGTQALTISNTGSASVTISAISTGNAAFTFSGVTLPVTIAAGGSATLQVTFAPSAASTYSSTMTISSNASNPTLSIGLSGTGATATVSHQVTINWSESATVTGFNVYRSAVSGSGYTMINTSLITSTSYVDSAVTAGATYYYVVTAVDASGVESAYSSQAAVTVPTP